MTDRVTLRAYQCGVKGMDWQTLVNATSRGRAKSRYFSDIRDSWQDIPFTALTCTLIGAPRSTERLERCAKYRAFPVVAGSKVRCNGSVGYVVDGNSSANFSVEFFDGEYKGKTLSCHPSELEIVQ